MTPELFWLTLTCLLAALLWIPYVVGVAKIKGDPTEGFSRPRDLTTVPAWVHRAHRAHLNLLEQLVPFAIIVIIAHLVNAHSTATVWACIAFFFIRAFHAFGMISGYTLFPARSIVFNLGVVCVLVMGWSALTA